MDRPAVGAEWGWYSSCYQRELGPGPANGNNKTDMGPDLMGPQSVRERDRTR